MKKLFLFTCSILVLNIWILTSGAPPVSAAVCGEDIPKDEGSLRTYIADCQAKKDQLSGQAQTLLQALSVLNTQIKLTQAKIAATSLQLDKLKSEIDDLASRIDSIDYSLTDLTKIFVSRVRDTYMYRGTYDAFLVSQISGLPSIVRAIEYGKIVRDHDRNVLIALEKSRLDYNTQKETKESKQKEIETLKTKLDRDKSALAGQVTEKNKLLAETKNSESQYQKLLAEAQAELIAIQGIIAGLGKEVQVKDVGEGERIASIIQGSSPCSTGTHLHFEVAQNSSRRDPFSLLRSLSLSWDNADPPQNGSGSWNWPLNDPIKITQGYGHTSYSSRYTGNVHTGVDMVSDNATVKAVKPGILYRGSMKCHCTLPNTALFFIWSKH
ncbi:MAG: Peptidase, M23 family [Microgenomates group bacterium GW2011_GWA2_46_7]|nr:MAG: Peptidase, M23 family [Microgenomates group bacterium GW2011_GWA2_46_7]